MADSADDYGERAATETEVDDWVTLVRSGRTAGFRPRTETRDRIRPDWGTDRASSEGDA